MDLLREKIGAFSSFKGDRILRLKINPSSDVVLGLRLCFFFRILRGYKRHSACGSLRNYSRWCTSI